MRVKVSISLMLAALLTGGCGNEEMGQLMQLACPAYTETYMAWMRNALPPPTAVPGVLREAAENRSSYVPGDDHPLADVITGTVMDDLSSLDGCWASVEVYEPGPDEVFYYPETGQPIKIEMVSVMCFDRANQRATIEHWVDRAPVDDAASYCAREPSPMLSQKPGFLSVEHTYEVIRDGMIMLNGVDGNGGQIEADGTISFNSSIALAVSINATTTFPMLMTVQGNYLKTREGGLEPDDLVIGESEEYARLWIKVK